MEVMTEDVNEVQEAPSGLNPHQSLWRHLAARTLISHCGGDKIKVLDSRMEVMTEDVNEVQEAPSIPNPHQSLCHYGGDKIKVWDSDMEVMTEDVNEVQEAPSDLNPPSVIMVGIRSRFGIQTWK
ncbi:hypothetical protein RRG08_043212 [Elysia crispata]|uniref:Uncharacterized protein n=1 Tax=Elysia crispata TaxID=231223 RepID=A0AAE1DGQ3_9GAST|nr:hypothetical protein RRG08_043212 [Elysia crispata]